MSTHRLERDINLMYCSTEAYMYMYTSIISFFFSFLSFLNREVWNGPKRHITAACRTCLDTSMIFDDVHAFFDFAAK